MFVTFEGVDGSGKSTCINKIKEYINNKYDANNFVFTREPGGFDLKECEQIRNILLDKNNIIDSMTEMLLYLASRKMHVERLIKPALENKKIVFCDRFYDSSIAYQGNGRSLGMQKVENMNLEALNNFKPDFTFYFKINLETSINRMKSNNRNFDRLENEDKIFFQKVIEGYDYLSKKEKRFIVIDANQSIDQVFDDVINELEKNVFSMLK